MILNEKQWEQAGTLSNPTGVRVPRKAIRNDESLYNMSINPEL